MKVLDYMDIVDRKLIDRLVLESLFLGFSVIPESDREGQDSDKTVETCRKDLDKSSNNKN